MINYLKLAFSIFLFVTIFVVIFLIISLILTKKFRNRFREFYAIFLGISKREILIHATNTLNFLVLLYFLFNVDKFNTFGLYMIILINVISCIGSFNIKIIFLNIIYTFISALLFILLSLVNNYLTNVIFDDKVYILKILFMILILFFVFYITIRKLEILVKSYKIRRVSYEK